MKERGHHPVGVMFAPALAGILCFWMLDGRIARGPDTGEMVGCAYVDFAPTYCQVTER